MTDIEIDDDKVSGIRLRFFSGIRLRIRRNMPLLVTFSLILLLLTVYLWNSMFVTIKSGEAGVMYLRFFGGTITDRPYDEGFHYVFPWDELYVYNVRHQVLPHSFMVLTKRGLPLEFHLTIRFRPDYAFIGLLHQEVGPDFVKKIVLPEVEATIRSTIAQYNADEVYSTKRELLQKIVNQSLEAAAERYVEIDDVMITKIELPPAISVAIENKLVEEQRMKAYEYILATEKQEARRKKIESEGIDIYQRTVASSLTDKLLTEKGIRATESLASSANAKVVIVGGGNLGLPLILGGETAAAINAEADTMKADGERSDIRAQLKRTMPTRDQNTPDIARKQKDNALKGRGSASAKRVAAPVSKSAPATSNASDKPASTAPAALSTQPARPTAKAEKEVK